ncbi:hypothetical protein [Xanthobacter sediminis]
MMNVLTIIYAAFALIGGAVGARISGARIWSGLVAAGVGFVGSVIADLFALPGLASFLVFVVVAAAVAFALKLSPRQIIAVVVGTVVVSFIGGFLIGLGSGIESAASHPGGS